MNRKDINQIRDLVHQVCKSPKNHAGYSAWTHHIVPAVLLGVALAKELRADEEVVELALWLHDLGSVSCGEAMQDKHHETGRDLAKEILEKYRYPKDQTDKVLHCIYAHRATQDIPRETLEANIVASADALSHFYYVDDLLFYAYVIKRLETDAGREFVLKKLSNSYKKLMPEAKTMIEQKYEKIKIALRPGIDG